MPPSSAAPTRNPVEKRMAQLHDLWWERTDDPALRAIVLRVPPDSQRMLDAFFALQMVDSAYGTPDLFLRVDTAFETGFRYSRELRQELIDTYRHNRPQLVKQGVTGAWDEEEKPGWDSPAGFVRAGLSLARHLRRQRMSIVLQPGSMSDAACFERWLDAAMQTPVPPQDAGLLRLVLVDDSDTRAWQPLVERHGGAMRVVDAPLDILEAAREIAAQSGGGGNGVALFRQLYADMLSLLRQGDAAGVEAAGERALRLATRNGWADQRAVLDMVVGGAWLQARDFGASIARYRRARDAATEAAQARNPMGATLFMQGWMAEGGAWAAAGDMKQAAHAFEQAADAAHRVPHPMFAVEGHRAAAQAWRSAGDRERAWASALAGIREARAMADADRPHSTVPQLLHDMLVMQDPKRCERIAQCATTYERDARAALVEADLAGHRLGEQPPAPSIDAIEAQLTQRYEQVFEAQLREREKWVQGGEDVFRTVIALGRQWLDPAWSGLPQVRHPLDQPIGEWKEAPLFARLPDPRPFVDAA